MRLINTQTYELEFFFDRDVPEYAILSHTWGPDEVSYAEIPVAQARLRSGWRKIEFACRQALLDGHKYIWADTCAIDKSSSAELSEAINSMFRWYKNAQICYAYLADVSLDELESTFASSRWFTRGWTLQELIAPKQVRFYDKDWRLLGDKHGLAAVLSNLTTIDTDTLEGKASIFDQSIARRMSWASSRCTTREEDTAYSLLGLFGVHMPLLYGEGANAFIRLQQEIIKISTDHSIFAWDFVPVNDEGDLPAYGYLPRQEDSRGVLATSPSAFAESGGISPITSSRPSSYDMTNLGLRISIPVVNIAPPAVLGLLACQVHGQEQQLVGIMLCLSKFGYTRYLSSTREGSRPWSTTTVPGVLGQEATIETIDILQHHDTLRPKALHYLSENVFHEGVAVSFSREMEQDYNPVTVIPEGARWSATNGRNFLWLLPVEQTAWAALLLHSASRGSVVSIYVNTSAQDNKTVHRFPSVVRILEVPGPKTWPKEESEDIDGTFWPIWVEARRHIQKLKRYTEASSVALSTISRSELLVTGRQPNKIHAVLKHFQTYNHVSYRLELDIGRSENNSQGTSFDIQ
jgi:hypothetical protein